LAENIEDDEDDFDMEEEINDNQNFEINEDN